MSYYFIGYILVFIGAMLMLGAQAKVSRAYHQYSRIPNRHHYTGEYVARSILDAHGLTDVKVGHVRGQMSDHYNPKTKTVNLSDGVYQATSIAALAIAAHECGHAIQHKEGYRAIIIRNTLIPLFNVSQYLGWIAIVIGLLTNQLTWAYMGVFLLCGMLIYQCLTLPIEFDASNRALKILSSQGYLEYGENEGASKVLSAAALTYVAGMASTVLSILRILLIVIGNDRDR